MFTDRRDAGRQLARLLVPSAGPTPVVVALPRGGVPVAAEVADRLGAPLDIIVVRKLGSRWQPELGVGAIAEGDVRVLNETLVRAEGMSAQDIDVVTAREQAELERRVRRYRGGRPPVDVAGRPVIVVDDGLATGYTARAAIEALRRRGATRITLAVPVAPEDASQAMLDVVDEVVVVETPAWFFAIGEFYEDFSQTTDDEVDALLAANGRAHGGTTGRLEPAAPG
jgi:putative phosphoribosyl transferase